MKTINARSLVCLSLAVWMTLTVGELSAQRSQPNFLVIMVDDMGFSDAGCYGGEILTPNIDALAANGLRYTSFYNAAKCNVSRDAFISGTYPGKSGTRGGNGPYGNFRDADDTGNPADWNASDHVVTIPEVLRPAGYRTYHSGKWHAQNVGGLGTFDRFYGLPAADSYYDPPMSTEDGSFSLPRLQPGEPNTYHMTDATTDMALAFLQDHDDNHRSAPFFLNLCYNAPHWPLHELPQYIQPYDDANTFDAGWDVLRQARYDRMIALGVIDDPAKWPLPENTEVKPWKRVKTLAELYPNGVPAPQVAADGPQNPDAPTHFREWEIRRMEVHAAMVTHLDEGIGEVVQKLKDLGEYDNTVIMFLSDNGCSPENHAFVPDETKYETRDGSPIFFNSFSWIMPGPENTRQTVGIEWSVLSNAPFRGWKGQTLDGGSCTPFIVSWPIGIPPSEHGTFRRQIGHLVDIMPTFTELAGAEYPSEHDGKAVIPTDGISLIPSFSNQPLERDSVDITFTSGHRAVITDDWKLVGRNIRGGVVVPDTAWDLYDYRNDRTETNDVGNANPGIRSKLIGRWQLHNAKEVAWYHPNPLPADEDFESSQLDFVSTGSVDVQTGVGEDSSKGRKISGSTQNDLIVSLDNGQFKEVTTKFSLNPTAFGSSDHPLQISNSGAHFRISSVGQLEVRDGFTWISVPLDNPIEVGAWHAVTVINDFTTKTWRLWIDSVPIGSSFALFEDYERPVDLIISQFGGNAASAIDKLLITEGSTPPPPLNFPQILGVSTEGVGANVAANLLDGDKGDGSFWAVNAGFPQSVVFDYGSSREIVGARLWTNEDRPYQFVVEVSESPTGPFTTVVDRTSNAVAARPVEDRFPAVRGRYVRLRITGVADNLDTRTALNEFEIIVGAARVLYSEGFEASVDFSEIDRVPYPQN